MENKYKITVQLREGEPHIYYTESYDDGYPGALSFYINDTTKKYIPWVAIDAVSIDDMEM